MSKDVIERYVVFNNRFGGFGLSEAAVDWLRARGYSFEYDFDVCRHDQLLALCVMELGSPAASGSGAELKVHKLKGNCYIIDEYDGSETVIEPPDIDWIVLG